MDNGATQDVYQQGMGDCHKLIRLLQNVQARKLKRSLVLAFVNLEELMR